MTTSALSIITLILSLAAVAAMFFPRIPAVLAAYAALVCAHFAGAVFVTPKVLIFWGVASAIVLGLRAIQPPALAAERRGSRYVALAAIVGVVLGFVLSPTSATVITGGVVGAFFGAMAFNLSPAGPRMPLASTPFFEYLGAKGLPAVVTAAMAAIAVASLL